MPGRELTPNEMYAALVETAGYVPVPLAASDYVELLPVTWRKINAYGVKIGNRTYDCKALTPCRRQHSGVNAKKGSWEVRFDPHDITRVWVRDHLGDGGWILAPWTHLRTAPAPFGEQAWEHARKMLARRGQDPVTEGDIARAAAALLDRAEQGPAKGPEERRDRKATARARAASAAGPSVPEEETPQPAGPPAWDDSEEDGDGPLADVIPLGIFDAREEAKKWW
jgi:putative transposase